MPIDSVIATMYAGAVNAPLFCSTPARPLSFSPHTDPWVAFPVERYQSGEVQCGDWIVVKFPSGQRLYARAWDAGGFGAYCVRQHDGSCPSIEMGIPSIWWPMGKQTSSFVDYTNLSAARRAFRAQWTGADCLPPLAVGISPVRLVQ